MAELARNTALPRNVDDVLEGVTAAAVEMIPGTDTCGVLLIGKGRKFSSLHGTSDLIYELDALQEEYGEGPCISAAVDELIVRTDDFSHEQRWPKYSAAMVDLGVRSGLSFKLYTSASTAGALNLFSLRPHAFNGESEAIGAVLRLARVAAADPPTESSPSPLVFVASRPSGASAEGTASWPVRRRQPGDTALSSSVRVLAG